MITLTHEEARQVLDALKETWYHVGTFAPTEKAVYSYDKAIELLRTKMDEYPKNQVRPHEFLKAVEGKENFIGIPIIWAEWPTREEV
jgi:hypothetical protein